MKIGSVVRVAVVLVLVYGIYRETGIWTALAVLVIAVDSAMTNHLFRLSMRALRNAENRATKGGSKR